MKQMKLFLSYARDDDQAFVKRLHNDLKRLGFDVWRDMVSMPSRDLTFLQEIRDVINDVDRLLLVIGPHAVKSDYVRVEWEYAREICTPINPIMRVGVGNGDNKEDFGQLPDELKNLDTRDFRDDANYAEQLDRLVKQLREDIPPLGRLSPNVPALPPHHLPRPEHLSALSEYVLRDINMPTVIASEHKTTTVQGMGGIGKTVIAIAFAHACTTRRAFSDGIVWVTVGQHAEMRDLYEVAGVGLGDTPQNYREEIDAKANLRKMLTGKTCLIVLDDVWHMEHAAPFRDLVADGRSRLLITTRDGGLAAGLGAQEHVLDLLRDEQALALLAEWSDLTIDTLPDEAPDVVHECGNLPLALAMIGATVRGKLDRWRHVLHRLRTADLSKIRQRFPNYPYETILNVIKVSVDELEPENRARYLDFAVFREDSHILETTVITLWEPLGLDEFDAVEVLDDLVARSLVRRERDGRLVLHDLQVDYVRNEQVRQDAGAEPVLVLHERLLTAYRAKCNDGWHTGPNDGYFFENFAYHLCEAGRKDELYTLLTESAPDGGPNPWMEAKFAACVGDTRYAADLALAISNFTDPLDANQLIFLTKLHAAQQVIYSRVSSYTNDDLQILVWLGREQEALSHARLRNSPEESAYSLVSIYDVLVEQDSHNISLLDEIYSITQNFVDLERPLYIILAWLGMRLAQANNIDKAKQISLEIPDATVKANALKQVVMALAQVEQFQEAQTLVEEIGISWVKASALSKLATYFEEAGQADKASTFFENSMKMAEEVDDDWNRVTAQLSLAVDLANTGHFSEAGRAFHRTIQSSEQISGSSTE